jgi:hypothetical protein
MRSVWDESFHSKVASVLEEAPPRERLDFGCALQSGVFEYQPESKSKPSALHFSPPDEALIFFIIRLMERLRALGTAPAADLMEYGRSLKSLVSLKDAA